MKNIFRIALTAALAFMPVMSQAAITGEPSYAGTIARAVSVAAPSYAAYAGARSTLLVIKNSPGVLGRIFNTNTTTQTATFTCYDNASAASGTVLWAGVLGAAASATGLVDPEIFATNGITCIASVATVAGNGINVTFW